MYIIQYSVWKIRQLIHLCLQLFLHIHLISLLHMHCHDKVAVTDGLTNVE